MSLTLLNATEVSEIRRDIVVHDLTPDLAGTLTSKIYVDTEIASAVGSGGHTHLTAEGATDLAISSVGTGDSIIKIGLPSIQLKSLIEPGDSSLTIVSGVDDLQFTLDFGIIASNIDLTDHADVNITAAQDLDVIQYDLGTTNFVNRTIDGSGIVDKSGTQTITGPKIFTKFRLRDSSLLYNYIFSTTNLSTDRSITYPILLSNDVPVFENHISTLTNKTINYENNTLINLPSQTYCQLSDSLNGVATEVNDISYTVLTLNAGALITSGQWSITAIPNGTIKYTGVLTRQFRVTLMVSIASNSVNNEYDLRFFRNGLNTGISFKCGSDANGKLEQSCLDQVITLATDNTLEVRALDLSGSSDLTPSCYNWIIVGLT